VGLILKNADVFGKICDIKADNGKIVFVGKCVEDGIDLKGKKVIPGMVDTHVHGCVGKEALDCDLEAVCDFFAKKGTTSFLPTTVTASPEALIAATNQKTDFRGAQVLGYHIEGPYISMEYKGAQDPNYVREPSIEEFSKLNNVKVITVAPEIPGAERFIKKVSCMGCVVSLGHTSCDYETASEAFSWGAKSLTHTCNAMKGLHHRNPGPIGAAVMRDDTYIELICDTVHVHPAMILTLYRTFGADRVVFISDSLSAAGLPDGMIKSGDLDVYVKDGKATLKDGTIAGSTSTLFECMKKAVEIGIPFEDAVKMASETPAKRINVNKGKIEAGYDADFIILSEDMEIEDVIINGEFYK